MNQIKIEFLWSITVHVFTHRSCDPLYPTDLLLMIFVLKTKFGRRSAWLARGANPVISRGDWLSLWTGLISGICSCLPWQLQLQSPSNEVFKGSVNCLVKCSDTRLELTLWRNISASHSRNEGKTLLAHAVPVSAAGAVIWLHRFARWISRPLCLLIYCKYWMHWEFYLNTPKS